MDILKHGKNLYLEDFRSEESLWIGLTFIQSVSQPRKKNAFIYIYVYHLQENKSIFPWYLYKIVTQSMLRTYDVK